MTAYRTPQNKLFLLNNLIHKKSSLVRLEICVFLAARCQLIRRISRCGKKRNERERYVCTSKCMSSTIKGRSTSFAKPNGELHDYPFKDSLKMCLERAFKPHRSSTTEPRGHDVLSYLCDKLARHGCAPEQTSDHHQNRFRSNRLPVTTLRQGRAEYAPI